MLRRRWLTCVLGIAAVTLTGCVAGPRHGELEKTAGEVAARTGATAILAGKVKRQGSKVWLDGVANFDNSDEGVSHLRAVACLLRNYGEEVDWDWLMGASGEAFCYYYHPSGTFLSQFVHSWDVANTALGLYGYAGRWRPACTSDDIAPGLAAIEAEIAPGRLLIAPGIMPERDGIRSRCHYWFIICGVDPDARKVTLLGAGEDPVETSLPLGADLLSYVKGSPPSWYGIIRTFGDFPGHYGPDKPIFRVRRIGRQADARTAAVAAIEQAIRLSRERPTVATIGMGRGTYLSGLAALQRLHDDLLAARGDGLEQYKRLNKPRQQGFGGLGDELEHLRLLSVRRRSAARFLTQVSPLLPAEARPHLAGAAKCFEDSAACAMKAFTIRYGSPQEYARRGERICGGGYAVDNPAQAAYWKRADEALASSDNRKAMADHIDRIIKSEKAALAEMQKARAAARRHRATAE